MAGHGRRVSVLGVPTSAGSHNAGQEKAPAAWRAAGLIDALRAAGLDVEDRGDLPAGQLLRTLADRVTRALAPAR